MDALTEPMSEFIRLKHQDGVHPFHIPEKSAYGARKGCLDEICAWENFGGLTLEQAYARFCERPDIYQEDFMFMGWTVFRYYYPVIETYLHEAQVKDEFEDTEAWILAKIIGHQWENPRLRRSKDLHQRLLNLCAYVKSHLNQYSLSPRRQADVRAAWAELEDAIMATS